MAQAGRERDLKKYLVESENRAEMLDELRVLGISHSSVFPDLDGLAEDIAQRYWEDESQVEGEEA